MSTAELKRSVERTIFHVVDNPAKASGIAVVVCHNDGWVKALKVQNYHYKYEIGGLLNASRSFFALTI